MGVFPSRACKCTFSGALPHARGGVSGTADVVIVTPDSSPRPWGCFSLKRGFGDDWNLFPTPGGVFRQHLMPRTGSLALPHARGGVSGTITYQTYKGISSPRPWGCFRQGLASVPFPALFPTPGGVFLPAHNLRRCVMSLPHARGGVSLKEFFFRKFHGSSPRPWGCF